MAPLAEGAPLAPGARHAGLDRARAVAALAMVVGHTLDAVLSEEARMRPGVIAYWSLRAITAPLFLFVAGWAFAATVQRTELRGWPLLRRYLPRVGLLLGWGYFLRWPGWGVERLVAGEREVWEHFLGFDALHGVGGALLVGAVLLAVLGGRAVRMVALAALVVLYPLAAPGLREVVAGWPLALVQALAGRSSSFPLFPWSAYFFAGAFTGLGLGLLQRREPWAVLLGTGTAVLGLMQFGWGGNPEVSDIALVVWRLGLLLVTAGLVMLVPRHADGLLGPVGRASLWVYIIHLPMTYGWSDVSGLATRVGRSLGVVEALGAALGVLAVSLGLALPLRWLYGRWRKGRRRAGPVAEAQPVPAQEPPRSKASTV